MRIIKQILVYTIVTAGLTAGTMALLGYLYQDAIISRLKKELNSRLNSEIQVSDINVNVFRAFPLVSVEFHHILGYESKDYTNLPDTLFYFDRLSLAFDFFKLVDKEYQLKHVLGKGGKLFLKIDRKGHENYNILLPDTSGSHFSSALEKIDLNDCFFSLVNDETGNVYNFSLHDIKAKGTFTDSTYTAALYGKTTVDSLIIFGTSYLKKETLFLDVGIEGNTLSRQFQVSRGFVKLRDEYELEVTGNTSPGKYRFDFNGHNLDIAGFRSLIPADFTKTIRYILLKGKADFSLTVQNEKARGSGRVSGNIRINKGKFINDNTGLVIDLNHIDADFTTGSRNSLASTKVHFKSFDISTARGTAKGTLKFADFIKPKFQVEATGSLNPAKWLDISSDQMIAGVSGTAGYKLKLSGKLATIDTITPEDIRSFRFKGELNLAKPEVKLRNGTVFSSEKIRVNFSDKHIVFNSFDILMNDLPVNGSLVVENWQEHLADSTVPLTIKGKVNMIALDKNDFESDESTEPLALPRNIDANIAYRLASFTYDNFAAANIRTTIHLDPGGHISLRPVSFDVMNGQVAATLSARETEKGFSIRGKSAFRNIDISQMFYEFDNFGQKTLTDKHLGGTADIDADFSFTMNHTGHILLPSVMVEGDVRIVNGAIKEFEPLYSIPSEITDKSIIGLFVKLDAFEKKLHHITFDTLSNHILVQNEKIIIPDMHIASNALGLNLRGTHGFDNVVDYYISFNLSEVLSKNGDNTPYDYIEDNARGGKTIYLRIFGPIDDLTVKPDKEATRKNRKEKIAREVNTAKAVLYKELGAFKNSEIDTTLLEEETFEYDIDIDAFNESLEQKPDSLKKDSVQKDSVIAKGKKKKKKKKKKNPDDKFEDWDFDDEDL